VKIRYCQHFDDVFATSVDSQKMPPETLKLHLNFIAYHQLEKGEYDMHSKIAKLACILIIATIFPALVMSSALISAASSSTTATASIEPPSIIDTTLVPGETFVINVSVTDVSDLYTWEIRVYFDINIVNVTDAVYPLDHVFAGKPYIPVTPVVDQDADGWYVSYGCSLVGAAATFTGNGTLGQIEFEVKSIGSCNLQFSRPYGQFTFLLDSNLENIDANLQDGYFSNKLPPPTSKVYVDPSRIVDPLLIPCNNFTVNINIGDATDLYSFEFKLGFDKNILNVVEVLTGDFFPPVVPTVTIDNVVGYMWFSASLSPPESPKNGDGTLAVVKFHVENSGASDLSLYDVQLKDQADQPLPHETSDGYFNNVLLTKLYVDPPEIIDPSLIPPATVDINVTIDDVEGMYGYEFKLGYDENMLVCMGVVINPVLGEINYVPNLNIDNIAGVVWVNVTYYPPANPITTYSPLALATITFRIIAMGSSVLDLYDTSLVDQTGQPIGHEIGDGFIMTLIRDVAIVNVTTSDNVTYQGRMINITVTARNEGKQSETFVVNIYHGTTLIGNHTVTDLAPDYTETTFTFSWDTTNASCCHNYTISAEAPPLPDEIDTADNMFEDGYVKIKMLGDVNGDNKINILDISEAAQAFGSYPGHPRWNPELDLNRDDAVNMRDLSIIARLFGKECGS